MTKRYDIMIPRPGREEGKTFWHRIGTAWEGEKGINGTLDSLPIPDAKGKVSFFLFEPREKQQASSGPIREDTRFSSGRGERAPQAPVRPLKQDLDDEIPF